MKKMLTSLFLLSLVCSFAALGQVTKYNFKFNKSFPDTNFKQTNAGHGIAVDPEGKVWIQRYNASDSMLNAAGVKRAVRVIYVYKPDGTPASFSPIMTMKVGTATDTLINANVGLEKDNLGNILVANREFIYRVNYKTGVCMGKLAPGSTNAFLKPAVDDLGEVLTGYVLPGVGPLALWDASFTSLGNALDTTKGYSRTLSISKDGNDVFYCSYSPKYVLKIHSDNGSLGPYNKIDTLFGGKLAVESITWHPKTNYLWVSSGNNFAPSATPGFTDFSFYAFVPPNYTTPVDSFMWNGSTANDPRPRGIAFTPTGDSVYVICFNDGLVPMVQRFIKGVTSVKSASNAIVKEYALGQNYPNPFNPSTTITFSLPVASTISLKVYDVLGKEVATVAEGRYEAGAFTATFDAKNVNSGVYFYTLRTSNGFVQSNKMMLMK